MCGRDLMDIGEHGFPAMIGQPRGQVIVEPLRIDVPRQAGERQQGLDLRGEGEAVRRRHA